MKTGRQMSTLWLRIHNEKGAEVVEWVIWTGGILVLAGVLYSIMSSTFTAKASAIMNSIGPVAS